MIGSDLYNSLLRASPVELLALLAKIYTRTALLKCESPPDPARARPSRNHAMICFREGALDSFIDLVRLFLHGGVTC